MDKFLFMERQTLSRGGRKIRKKKIPFFPKKEEEGVPNSRVYFSVLFIIFFREMKRKEKEKKEAYY
jgi:hypothetical protein